MCGIFGGMSLTSSPELDKIKVLGLMNQERGEDSCGILYGSTLKKGVDHNSKWSQFLQNEKIKFGRNDHIVIGHVRKSTQGTKTIDNAHPFKIVVTPADKTKADYEVTGCHNGNIINWRALATKKNVDVSNITVDSRAIMKIIAVTFRSGDYSVFKEYDGKAALVWRFSDEEAVYMFHGKSKEYYTSEPKEERPLHYFIDPKKKVMYFSSEEGPLQAIAPDDAEIIDVPHNIIWRVTPEGATKVVEIDRTLSNVVVPSSSATTSRTMHRSTDNGEFSNRTSLTNSRVANKQLSLHTDEMSGVITLPDTFLKTFDLRTQIVKGILLPHMLQAKDENSNAQYSKIVFYGNRYYRNGHLANGKYFVAQNGTCKPVTKRNASTLKYTEDNVVFEQKMFEDGLLFEDKRTRNAYIKLKKKLDKKEASRPGDNLDAYVNFMTRVLETVPFTYPVYSWGNDGTFYLNGKKCSEKTSVAFPYSNSIGVFDDGKLVLLTDTENKVAYLKQGAIIFSSEREYPSQQRISSKSLLPKSQYSLLPSRTVDGEELPVPASYWFFDYEYGKVCCLDTVNKNIKVIAYFWADHLQDIKTQKCKTYCAGVPSTYPIGLTLADESMSIDEFNNRLAEIIKNENKYLKERKVFFDMLEDYCANNGYYIDKQMLCTDIYDYRTYKLKSIASHSRELRSAVEPNHSVVYGYNEPANTKSPPLQLKAVTLSQITRGVEEADGKVAKTYASNDWIIDFETRSFWVSGYNKELNYWGWKNLYKFDIMAKVDKNEICHRPIYLSTNPNPIFRTTETMASAVRNFVKERSGAMLTKYESAKKMFATMLEDYGYRLDMTNDLLFICQQNRIQVIYKTTPPSQGVIISENLKSPEKNYSLIDDFEEPVEDLSIDNAQTALERAYHDALSEEYGEDHKNDELLNDIADHLDDALKSTRALLNQATAAAAAIPIDPRLEIFMKALKGVFGICQATQKQLIQYNENASNLNLVNKPTIPPIDFSTKAKSEEFFRTITEGMAAQLSYKYAYEGDGLEGDIMVSNGLIYRSEHVDVGDSVRMYEVKYVPIGEWEASKKPDKEPEITFQVDPDYFKTVCTTYNEKSFNNIYQKQVILSKVNPKVIWPSQLSKV